MIPPSAADIRRDYDMRIAALHAAVRYVERHGGTGSTAEVLKHAETFLGWLKGTA